jgi:hypothetical protein
MSGTKKDTFHIAMAGVSSLGTSRRTKSKAKASKVSARRGGVHASKAAGSRADARARRL